MVIFILNSMKTYLFGIFDIFETKASIIASFVLILLFKQLIN